MMPSVDAMNLQLPSSSPLVHYEGSFSAFSMGKVYYRHSDEQERNQVFHDQPLLLVMLVISYISPHAECGLLSYASIANTLANSNGTILEHSDPARWPLPHNAYKLMFLVTNVLDKVLLLLYAERL